MKYRTGKSCSYHHRDNCWELPSLLIISPPLGWAALICDWGELPLPLLQAVPGCHQRLMSRCPDHDPETARNQNKRSGDHPNENKRVKNKRTCTSWRVDEGYAARGGDQQTSHRRWRCPPRFCRRRRAGERRMAGTHLIYAVSFHDPINMG